MRNRTSSIRSFLIISVVLFAATWGIYANSLGNQFAFDDKSLIVENTFLSRGVSLARIFSSNYRAGAGFIGDGLYRPLVILTYVWNKGETLSPLPFHLFNVTVNALNPVLLFLLIQGLTGNIIIAALTGIFFGFHPIHTEAVSNIAGRPEILCCFFILASWIILERPRWRFPATFFGSVLFFAALLSKETAMVFPFMIIGADVAMKRHLFSRNAIIKYVSLLCVLILYLVVRWKVLGPTAAGLDPTQLDNPIAHSPSIERIAVALGVFLRYLRLLVLPVSLSADYSYNQIPVYPSLIHPIPILGLLMLSGIIVLAMKYRKKSPVSLLALILFLFPYLLVSNLFYPVGTIMGERLLYIPAAGYAFFVAAAFAPYFARKYTPAYCVFGLILLLFAGKTITRNRDWHDDYTLFSADLKKSPRSVKILTNLGFLTGKKGRIEESMEYFRKALEIYPNYDDALKGYGRRLYDLKRYEESANYYAKAVGIAPQNPESRTDYAIVLQKLDRYDDAERELAIAIQLNPHNPLPFQEMSNVKIAKEDYQSALAALKQAESLGGDQRIILNNSAVAFFLSGNVTEAYRALMHARSKGIQINEELAEAIISNMHGMQSDVR